MSTESSKPARPLVSQSAFDVGRVDAALNGTIFHGKLRHFPSIGSTNTHALAEAQAGAGAGCVFLADEQTAGRGRGGHVWHSTPGDGLYMTVLLRPAVHAADALHLSLAAGVACFDAVREVTGVDIDVRWPNDLVTRTSGGRSQKLGGILTESASDPDGMLRHAAVGIGINLNQRAFPPELSSTASSLCLITGQHVEREVLVVALLRRLAEGAAALNSDESTLRAVRESFARVSTWAAGKAVEVAEDDGYTGVTEGLDPTGLLRVRAEDGRIRVVRHGGVRERVTAA